MIKMYHAEVLGKLPVMQHMLFGSILAYEGPVVPPAADPDDEHHGHVHSHAEGAEGHSGWHDACGIPVPSAFAAAAEAQKREARSIGGGGIRRVPFD